jgi:hypothetical protein
MHLLNSTKRARVTSNAIHLPGSRILHYVRFRYPINYDLVATRVPGDITYFEWHNSTGAVTLKRWFDKPIGYKFELMATATDLGPKNVTTSIIITLEVTYQLPIFDFGSGSGIISLEEGYNRFSVPIAKFYHSTKYYRSNSYSDRNEVIFFLLIRGRTEKTNKYGTFRAEQNGDDQRAVSIYLNKVLEYEKVSTDSTYTLTLQVHNFYKLLAEAQLTVSLIDLNNQAPIFTNVQSGKVFENEKAGTSVMTVSAVDYDATYPNNQVRYMISARNPLSIKDKFEINPNTGLITTKTAFDREEQAVYAVTIDAEDLQNSQHNVTSQKFRIAIADKNDNAPYFPQSTYQAEVSDDHDVGSRVIEVRALDLDTDASRTYYHIMSGDPGKAFKIEEQTGVIRLAKPLYYEGIKRYNLVVGALDGLYSSETNVVINILIKNQTNQAPIFTNVQSGKVFENEKAGTSVMTVSAVDYDATYPNNQVRYKISASNPSSIKDKFEINPNTGLITTKTAFDREEQAVYAVTIDAEDLQNSQPNVTSQKFRIAIADKNDNAPYFPQLTYQAEVPDDQDVGSRVIEVRALDLDTDASRTYYHIMSGDSGKAFKIEEQTGVIRVAKLLYYEGIKRYDLVVGASDGQYSSETNVVINILIKNQNNNVESGGNVLENE